LLAGRWIHIIRRPRPRGARRALLGLGGSLALGALVYAAFVYGAGYLVGFPLQPNLLVVYLPEVLVLMGVLALYPPLTSLLKTATCIRYPGTGLPSSHDDDR
jgi:hypothetical protein